MINFISNLPSNLRSGGFSGMNAAAFTAISKLDAVHYAGPINPPVILNQKIHSKFLRVIGLRGDFFCFSQKRLQMIAAQVQVQCQKTADLDFFHGFTPWILTTPQRPFIAWGDCTFRDYMNIFHRRSQFSEKDLKRIEHAEAMWLNKAECVIFSSAWAASRAIRDYSLDSNCVGNAGIFGEIEAPLKDAYTGSKQFVFISTNFKLKGGQIVLSAFQKLKEVEPEASLVVVGDRPPDASSESGITFTGYLRKENPQECAQLRDLFAGARALVHPTMADTTAMVIMESGYFGCPAITSRKFAIPEIVDDGRTGILLDDPQDVQKLADAMVWMIDQDIEYRQMRQAVWTKTHGQYSKMQFEERLMKLVSSGRISKV